MRLPRATGLLLLLLSAVGIPGSGDAQTPQDESARVLATAEAALEAITAGDQVAFTDLMIDEALMFPVGERDGETNYTPRSRAETRERGFGGDIIERGFDAEVRVSGPVAMVWLPYDLYVDGEWSHCGVDVFTMMNIDDAWKISSMSWSVLQPPDCEAHPEGLPAG